MGNWLCGHSAEETNAGSITIETVKPCGEHTSTIIFLHGLGDNGRCWSQNLKMVVPPGCKIICPNARPIPVSINSQKVMPAWFDIYGLSLDAPQDEIGISRAAAQVLKIVKAEMEQTGIPLERMMLGGFSQGGSVAIYSSLTSSGLRGLGGVVIMSSWLPLAQRLAQDNTKIVANNNLPILQCHGTADPTLPFFIGDLTNQLLKQFQFNNIEFNTVEGLGHACNEEELGYVQAFIQRTLGK